MDVPVSVASVGGEWAQAEPDMTGGTPLSAATPLGTPSCSLPPVRGYLNLCVLVFITRGTVGHRVHSVSALPVNLTRRRVHPRRRDTSTGHKSIAVAGGVPAFRRRSHV
jgi:hypothetical protein